MDDLMSFGVYAAKNGFLVRLEPAAIRLPHVARSVGELQTIVGELAARMGVDCAQDGRGEVYAERPVDIEALKAACVRLVVARSAMTRRPRGEGADDLEAAISEIRVAMGFRAAPPSQEPSSEREDAAADDDMALPMADLIETGGAE